MTKKQRLEIRKSRNGKGAFATKPIARGEIICQFKGAVIAGEEFPIPYDRVEGLYVQIGPDLYMGPSGGVDDMINHSCDPNAGLRIVGRHVNLVAVRNIRAGEEVTWDYSTTMDEGEWEMKCNCGSPLCRRVVRDYRTLPASLKRRYKRLGIVPDYLRDS